MPLPSFAQAWLQARESADAGLALITLYHPMTETRRFVRNTEAIVSRGDTYSPSPFEFDIPNDNDQPVRSRIRFPNVSREIGIELSRLVGSMQVTLEVISAAHPDEPICRAARLKLQNIQQQPLDLVGDLLRVDDGSETCGTIFITPARAPALFRRR